MITDFQGLIDVAENNLQFAEKQTNLQLVVMDEMTTRPGVREVTFADEG